MTIVGDVLKKKIEARLIAALAREHKDDIKANPAAAKGHKKLAAAISDIALDIVDMLLKECQVSPGQAVVGACSTGPVSGTTTSPGKLL